MLFDTHALIWFAEGSPSLSETVKQVIASQAAKVFCSVASIWEMAIKLSLGKLRMSLNLEGGFDRLLEKNGFCLLPIECRHAARVTSLPWHHRDLFDRLLIAQAMIEGLSIISHDKQFDAYAVGRIW
ncbi:MAG: type II toxin-antitoxin system VapC family toxin [Verrucomicrobiia bacterium]